jgi:hypothetical protein
MSALDTFERKGLFQLTRILALFVVGILFVGAAIGVVAAYLNWPKSENAKVSAAEVIALIAPEAKSEVAQVATDEVQHPSKNVDGLTGIVVPEILANEFSTINPRPGYEGLLVDPESSRLKNRRILADRMAALSLSKSEKQAYIDELAAAVSAAASKKLDHGDAIDSYMNLKQEKINEYRAQLSQAKAMRLWAAGVVVSVLFLIAMFSLVLVLLAIERNTRAVTPG